MKKEIYKRGPIGKKLYYYLTWIVLYSLGHNPTPIITFQRKSLKFQSKGHRIIFRNLISPVFL